MKSKFTHLNIRDFIRGFIVAFFTAFSEMSMQIINIRMNSGQYDFSLMMLKPALISGIFGGCGYLLLNFCTNSKGKLFKREKQ